MGELKRYQDPITIDEQISNLKEIGLIIENEEYAKQILTRISYYRLIKAYSLTMKKKGKYKNGARFEDIVDIYVFNQKLRILLFSIIEHIEISLRAYISNYFSIKYGNFGYLDLNNVENKNDNYKKALKNLKTEIERNNKSPFIKHFKNKYEGTEIPLYAAVEVTTFGTLSKMYKNMKAIDKNAIAKQFGVSAFYFESWLENFSYVRNICAHYGRLYNAKFTKTPKMYKDDKEAGVNNQTLFATIVNLKYVSEDEVYQNFINDLDNLINEFQDIDLEKIGFTENWIEMI